MDLFPPSRFRSYAPEKAKLHKPERAPVKFSAGFCNAACMFAIGPDCDCPCLGANHQVGFRCDMPKQEEIAL
jgi:hypothetical protein